ncbi:glycyl-radical enzyme activating protein [candidate division KSB1 bacterium]|nr:glycyl-radical enzyme activating protein [candidate division KSB1 bacterium]
MSANTTGLVFDIKKFAIHDGPGIRTTVFLKGCYLKCLWCHNPESLESTPEIAFQPDRCIGCGYCLQICPNGCHILIQNQHVYERNRCVRCGHCTLECYSGALEISGTKMTTAAVISEVIKDKPFYETSNGGMTISGGEPMLQFDFTKSLLKLAKQHHLHNCLDTSGHAPFEKYQQLFDDVDIFLYDIKETDPALHLEYVGVNNQLILKNLFNIDAAGKSTIIRCPIIPGLNDRLEHLTQIAEIANRLKNLLQIDVLPYHPLGISKSDRFGKESAIQKLSFPSDEQVNGWVTFLQQRTAVPIKKG